MLGLSRPFEEGEEVVSTGNHFGPHISQEIATLCERDARISLAEYRELRMNSWEQELVAKRLDDEALAWATENCLKNILFDERRPCITYLNALGLVYVPLLLERLAEKQASNAPVSRGRSPTERIILKSDDMLELRIKGTPVFLVSPENREIIIGALAHALVLGVA